MKKVLFVMLIVSALVVCAAVSAFAVTYSLTPSVDGYVHNSGRNFSSTELLTQAYAWSEGYQCLVKFDLSGVDTTGSPLVASATLTLNAKTVGIAGDCTVWQLGPTNWDASSCSRYVYDGVNGWPNYAGRPPWGRDGQVGEAVYEATAVTQNITGVGSYSWDVTSIVNNWLYGGASNSNSGLLIGTWQFGYGNFTGNSPAVSFYATEDTNAALRPILEIDVVPEPSSLAALAVGGLGLVGFSLRRRR